MSSSAFQIRLKTFLAEMKFVLNIVDSVDINFAQISFLPKNLIDIDEQ